MLNNVSFALLIPLALAIIGPLFMLLGENVQWGRRYILACIPAAYTGLGWLITSFASDFAHCKGGLKDIHGCLIGSVDISPLINHGFFLALVFFYALPISLWLLINTALKQLGILQSTMRK